MLENRDKPELVGSRPESLARPPLGCTVSPERESLPPPPRHRPALAFIPAPGQDPTQHQLCLGWQVCPQTQSRPGPSSSAGWEA